MKPMERWVGRAALVGALAVAALTSTGDVHAQASAPRTAASTRRLALHIEGKNASTVLGQILSFAPAGIDFVDAAEFDKALRQAGLPTALGYAIPAKAGRKALLKALDKAMEKANADALVLGREVQQGLKREIHLVLHRRGATAPELDDRFDLGETDAAQRAALQSALGARLNAFGGTDVDAAASRHFRKHTAGYELIGLRIGFDVGGRWFRYSDPVSETNTRPYDVLGPPGLHLGGEFYPAAPSGLTGLRDLGVTFEYVMRLPVTSKTGKASPDAVPADFDSSWSRLDVGLRYRWRLGDAERPFVLGLTGAYAYQKFLFLPANTEAEAIRFEVPSVRYQQVRAGLDAWLPLGPIALAPRLSYLAPFGTRGPDDRIPAPGVGSGIAPLPSDETVYVRFRGAAVRGLTAGLDLVYGFPSGLELRGGFDYTRYAATFSPKAGDAFVAGGATDELLEMRVGGGYRY